MSTTSMFKIGDVLMQRGHAFKIIAINQAQALGEQTESIIRYKPYFNTGRFKNLIRTVPIKNASLVNIRKPLTKSQAQELLESLKQRPEQLSPVNLRTAKELLNSNPTQQTVNLAITLWIEQANPDKKLSPGKRVLFEDVLMQLAQEIAVVFDLDLSAAEEKVLNHLAHLAPTSSN